MPAKLLDNRYQVVRSLGEGAMGAVYQVEESATGQTLAMKVLSRAVEGEERSYLLLKQEFRLMTQLRHPNCCAVYDYGLLENGAPFLTMELVPGHGLDERLPLPLSEVRAVLAQVLLALGYIHQLGYVHSDVKAANIRIKPDGTIKLMDYGLMELAGRSGGAIKGTLGYLAPEIVKSGLVDQRADLYAVGALAFELVTGRLPFSSEKVVDLLRMHLNDQPPRPSEFQENIDPKLESVILRLLEKNPLARYQSAYEVLEDLGIEVPMGIGGTLLNPPLVGRDQLLAHLVQQVERLKAEAKSNVVLLSGEAGSGKSRLLDEIRCEAQLAEVLYVAAAPRNTPQPYGPFVELLRHLVPLARVRVPETFERLAPVLIKLWPAIGDNWEQRRIEPAPDLDPPSREKLRLQDSFTTLVADLAKTSGALAMALDDWHRADPLSQELLEHLTRNMADAPFLLIICSQRAPEPAPLWMPSAEIQTLEALNAAEASQMVRAMLGTSRISENFLQRVVSFAQGNPSAIEQLIEHLVREQILTSRRGQWNTEIAIKPEDLPVDSAALSARKIEALPPDVRALAAHAAILGEAFSLELLRETGNWSDEALFDAVRVLEAAQILGPEDGGRYRFIQPDLQKYLSESVSRTQRMNIHAAALEVLRRQAQDTPPHLLALDLVTALATHSLQARDRTWAIPYAWEAGARLLALYALDAAEEFLHQGLTLMRENENDARQVELLNYLSTLGQVYRFKGRNKDAKEMQAEAIDLAELLGEHRKLGVLLGSQAKACLVLNENKVAIEYCSRAIQVSASVADEVNESRCLLVGARLKFFTGDLAAALTDASRAASLADAAGDNSLQGVAYALAGYFCVASSDPAQISSGIAQLERSVTLLLATSDKMGLINSYNLLGNAQNSLGNHPGALVSFQRCQTLSYESGSRSDEVVAVLNLAITGLELGQLVDAKRHAEEAERLSGRYQVKYTLGYAMALGALTEWMLGDGQRAFDRSYLGLALVREISNKYVEAFVLTYQMELMLALGQWDEATRASASLREVIDATGNLEPEPRLNAMLAELHCARQEYPEAEWRVELARQAAEVSQARSIAARALRIKAQLALSQEKWADADAHARAALAGATDTGHGLERARCLGILGELALVLGNGEASSYFEQMLEQADAMQHSILTALAHFGMAAAAPYSSDAAELAVRAQETLQSVKNTLPANLKTAFAHLPGHSQIFQRDYIKASIPYRGGTRQPWLLDKLRRAF